MGILNKQRNILDFTLSSLGRRKGKNLALVTVYTFVIFLLASVMFFTHSIKKESALILQGAPEMTVQRLVAGRQDLIPTRYVDSIRRIRGVQSVAPRLMGILLRRPERRKLHRDGQCRFERAARRDHHRQRRGMAERDRRGQTVHPDK